MHKFKVEEAPQKPRVGDPYSFPIGTLSKSTVMDGTYFLTVDTMGRGSRPTEVINLATGRIAPQASRAEVLASGSVVTLTQE